jgi:hypothetical protein
MRIMKPVDVVLSFYLAEFDTRTLQGHVISEHAVVVDTRTRSELVELAQTAIQIPAFEYLYHSDAARYPRSSTHVQEWLVGTTGQQRIRSVRPRRSQRTRGRAQTADSRSALGGGRWARSDFSSARPRRPVVPVGRRRCARAVAHLS